MRRGGRERGATLVEITIGSFLLVVVLAGANAMTSASSGVAQSTTNGGTADSRADIGLQFLGNAIRRGSFATLQHVDGTTFSDATNDVGFRVQAVKNYVGAAVLDTVAAYRFVLPGGATEGSIVRTQNGLDCTIVNGVTAFTVSRAGVLFTLDIRTRSGPTDDRARTVHATIQVESRNP